MFSIHTAHTYLTFEGQYRILAERCSNNKRNANILLINRCTAGSNSLAVYLVRTLNARLCTYILVAWPATICRHIFHAFCCLRRCGNLWRSGAIVDRGTMGGSPSGISTLSRRVAPGPRGGHSHHPLSVMSILQLVYVCVTTGSEYN